MRDVRLIVALAATLGASVALAGCGGDDSDGTPSSGAPIAGGGLSVAEAIDTTADPPLAVSGWVVRSDDEARLCTSYEPDADDPCGEPSLVLEGDDEHESGEQVSLLGAVEDGRFVVSGTSR
jgi:hypothetical protein